MADLTREELERFETWFKMTYPLWRDDLSSQPGRDATLKHRLWTAWQVSALAQRGLDQENRAEALETERSRVQTEAERCIAWVTSDSSASGPAASELRRIIGRLFDRLESAQAETREMREIMAVSVKQLRDTSHRLYGAGLEAMAEAVESVAEKINDCASDHAARTEKGET